jgi:membrane protein YdbS with pleckstrin-like domain
MENQETINKEETQRAHKAQMAQINRALGVFLLFFGAVVVASLLFTETFVGKMTNLVAGLILVLIGSIFILQTKLKREIP